MTPHPNSARSSRPLPATCMIESSVGLCATKESAGITFPRFPCLSDNLDGLLVLLSQKVAVSTPVESVFVEIHISLGLR
jgi:hypothetical protein